MHLQGPAAQQLEHEGIGVVVAKMGDAVGPVAFSSLFARREWLKTDMARAFMRAYSKGRLATKELKPKEVAEAPRVQKLSKTPLKPMFQGFSSHIFGLNQVVKPFFDIDFQVLSATVEVYQRMGCWDGDVSVPPETYERLLDAFLYSAVITKRHPYDASIAAVE